MGFGFRAAFFDLVEAVLQNRNQIHDFTRGFACAFGGRQAFRASLDLLLDQFMSASCQDDNGKERWLLIKGHADARPISRKRDDTSALTERSMEQIAHDKKSAQWNSRD